ncbi:MFS family permease [Arthrobacter pigmenti]|uniref:MFS family permease n=1 Tax=Arthrobacter pigmenti TaxID=271432 RepID=A0A846RMJ7_9MICC|nr:MFS transporter [Arthrobacter pigmenti]NJC21534.1 MFS family permease [Arthrobacter pigmenti]
MSHTPATRPQFSHARARRAGFAAFVGTAIEWYDFYIYATAAALVFGPLFFPEQDRLAGIALAFATYAVGFLVRPLGGIIFGHIGDKFGRRPSLVITLLIMGLSTMFVGLLPTYESIGAWAAVMLVILRALQGLAVGGEWGGAVLMAVEHAPEKHKTFYGGFPQLGNPAGALGATAIFAWLSAQGETFLIDGGWRIPFLLSVVLIAVGFWVRYRVEESPVFEKEVEGQNQSIPLSYALRNNWKPILLGIGLLPISTGGYYLATTFTTAYGTDPSVGLDATFILNAMSIASLCELITCLFIAWLGDKFGRKRIMFIGLVGSMVLIIPQFLLMTGGSEWMIFVAFAAVRVAMNFTYAPVATILSQLFRPQARYTSISLSYGVAAAVWAGLSPIAALWLFDQTGTVWSVIALFIAMGILGIICLALAPQHRDDDIFADDDDAATSAQQKESSQS